jgi:hypothetical protein
MWDIEEWEAKQHMAGAQREAEQWRLARQGKGADGLREGRLSFVGFRGLVAVKLNGSLDAAKRGLSRIRPWSAKEPIRSRTAAEMRTSK